MFGYIISTYKNPAKSPAIIFSDKGADDKKRRGGRGKTLFTKAIEQVRSTIIRGGDEFEPGYRHKFAGLSSYHNLFVLDDVPSGFNYDALYTQITGDIKVEGKGKDAVTIKYEHAPKFVATTNWAVLYDKKATSTNRRFAEYKFSEFWNIDNTPDAFFGNTFFLDWNHKEWQMFYEFLAVCVIQFLDTNLIKIEYSKEADNFRYVFSDEDKLSEFERVFGIMKSKDSFSVTEFLNEHKSAKLREKYFNHKNTKEHIETYIDYHKIEIKYEKSSKRWSF